MTAGIPFSYGYAGVFYTATAFGSEFTVQAPSVATRRVVLNGMSIGSTAAASITFKDGNSGSTIFQTPIIAAGGVYQIDLGEGIVCTAGNNLRAISSAATNVSGTIWLDEDI